MFPWFTLKRGFNLGRLFMFAGLALWIYQWITGNAQVKWAIGLLWAAGVVLLFVCGLTHFARTGRLKF